MESPVEGIVGIVHRTPGLLDIKAITVMGLSAKPNSTNPIGQFGTGLKYAISTLVRLGAEPRIFIGEDEYVFMKKKGEFRGTEYTGLQMRKKKKRGLLRHTTHELPYTTEYGKFWKPWMAFRELESNTIDEGGITIPLLSASTPGSFDKFLRVGDDPGYAGHTTIVIESPEYVEAWLKAAEVFLPDARRDGTGVQVVDHGGSALYFRGLKVYETPKKTLHSYNFLSPLQLTEDRTLSGDWVARYYFALHVLASDDEAFITEVLHASDGHWEHGLEFPKDGQPSMAFLSAVQKRPGAVGSSAWSLYAAHTPRERRDPTPWERCARPWRVEADEAGTYGDILDRNGAVVMRRPEGFIGDWGSLAQTAVDLINTNDRQTAPAQPLEPGKPIPVAPSGDDIPF